MIVIVPGDIERLEQRRLFECEACGCKFEASRNEYTPQQMYNDLDYRAACPYCGKAVYHGRLIAGKGGADE